MKRWGALVLAVVAIVGAQAGGASAATTDRGVWRLYEKGSPATAVDSSGFGNNGSNSNIVATGSGYRFNGTSSRVVMADKDSLDPGTADFSYGVTLVMDTAPARGETYDVLRKGVTTATGGEYKLEIEHVKGKAYAHCLVKDAKKVVASIVAPTNLADGSPHAITCSKTSRGVSVKIDSLAPRTKTVAALGSVSNTSKLALGAKAETKTNSGFDWYLGLMRDAWVRVG